MYYINYAIYIRFIGAYSITAKLTRLPDLK